MTARAFSSIKVFDWVAYSAALAKPDSLPTAGLVIDFLMVQADVVATVVELQFREVWCGAIVCLAAIFEEETRSWATGRSCSFGGRFRLVRALRGKRREEKITSLE